MLNYHPDESGVAYRLEEIQTNEEAEPEAKEWFAIHPNPAQDLLKVSFKNVAQSEGIRLSIYNSIGQQVFKEELAINNSYASFNIAHLKAGIYICKISRKGEQLMKERLVKID